MATKEFIKIILKKTARKKSLAVLIILLISSISFASLIGLVLVRNSIREYGEGRFWPTEIMITNYKGDKYANFTQFASSVDKTIDSIEGVKWHVYPGGGIYFDGVNLKYYGRNHVIIFRWCNVEDPTFPKPKFVIEGRFFKSNNESSILIESTGVQLLKDLGLYRGIGENGTIVDWFNEDRKGVNLTIAGIISDPLSVGSEESLLRKGYSDWIFAFVPLDMYYTLLKITKRPKYSELEPKLIYPWIYVKVKEGYSASKVVDAINDTYPGIVAFTKEEENAYLQQQVTRDTLVLGSILYSISCVLMILDVRFERKEIALLKVLGWKRKDILKYSFVRYTLLGIIAGVLGLILLLITLLTTYTPNFALLYIFETFLPYQLLLSTSATLISSIPAVMKAYNTNPEKVIRE